MCVYIYIYIERHIYIYNVETDTITCSRSSLGVFRVNFGEGYLTVPCGLRNGLLQTGSSRPLTWGVKLGVYVYLNPKSM